MADADQQDKTPSTGDNALEGLKSHVDNQLAQVADQIKQMNEQFATGLKQVADSVKPKQRVEEDDDDIMYDKTKLNRKIQSTASEIANQALAKERALNTKIFELSQSYPEISADDKVRTAVMNNHKALPQHLQGTPEGYEMAVLRAVSDNALVPKSKRPVVDEDISAGSGRSSREGSAGSKKAKVNDLMLTIAEALGRPVDDPEYVKRLEKAANRKSWMKYE